MESNPHAEQAAVPSPTIGRIVHFYPPDSEASADQPFYAAIITRVESPMVVDLCTLGPRSIYFHTGVELVTEKPEDFEGPFWRWPPRG